MISILIASRRKFSSHDLLCNCSDSVLGNTFQLPSSEFSTLRERTNAKMNPTKIGTMSAQSDNINFQAEQHFSRFKFDIEKMTPPVETPEGVIKTAKKAFWPVLEDSELLFHLCS
jgi:oxalate decarboxylase